MQGLGGSYLASKQGNEPHKESKANANPRV